MNRAISIISTILVVALAIAAFTLSYSALRALANGNGIPARLAWVWPLVVDGFLLVATLSVLRNSLTGERALYPWLLVGLFTAASIAFNVVHAGDNALAIAVGATPPVALALALELTMSQIKSDVARRGVRETVNALRESVNELTEERDELTKTVSGLSAEIDKKRERLASIEQEIVNAERGEAVSMGNLTVANLTRDTEAQEAIDALLTFYADNPGASQAEAAKAADRSRSWVSMRLSELEESGAITRNGRGVEVAG